LHSSLCVADVAPAVLAADVTPVPVASYANGPEVAGKDGKRTATILGDKKITYWPGDRLFDKDVWTKWAVDHKTGSAVVLFAPRDQSLEARLLLARVIKTEGLRITLLGDDAKSVTVENILERGEKP
jgi:hypothetical protein